MLALVFCLLDYLLTVSHWDDWLTKALTLTILYKCRALIKLFKSSHVIFAFFTVTASLFNMKFSSFFPPTKINCYFLLHTVIETNKPTTMNKKKPNRNNQIFNKTNKQSKRKWTHFGLSVRGRKVVSKLIISLKCSFHKKHPDPLKWWTCS